MISPHAERYPASSECHEATGSDPYEQNGRDWFSAIQSAGCIFASYGTVYSGSALARGSWLVDFLIAGSPGQLTLRKKRMQSSDSRVRIR